jgi:hypothetical protein
MSPPKGAYGKLDWHVSQGEDRYRRGLYTFSKRTAPYAMFNTFDGPSGEACIAQREISNSPLQALTLLNDTVILEAAQALGRSIAAAPAAMRSARGALPALRDAAGAGRELASWCTSSPRSAPASRSTNWIPPSSPAPLPAMPSSAPPGPRWPASCSTSMKPSPRADHHALSTDIPHAALPARTRRRPAALPRPVRGGPGHDRPGSLLGVGSAPAGEPAASGPLAPKAPHFPAKAKRVIHLFMAGAPSHLDLFDYKPELTKLEGKPLPPSVIAGQRYAFIRPDAAVLGPRFPFAKYGKSGLELSPSPRISRPLPTTSA